MAKSSRRKRHFDKNTPGAKPSGNKRPGRSGPGTPDKTMGLMAGAGGRDKTVDLIAVAVLLAFGIYEAVLFFGYKVVPNLDFPAFVAVGEKLLSGEMPASLKRAPVLGLLQVSISHIVPGATPVLTAGRIINSVLHPLTAVFIYLLAGRVVGRSAAFVVALLAVLNPWVIWLIPEPIAQPALLFFTVMSFFFMFRRSGWCYLFAAIASMTRYDGAALIAVAFVVDMIMGPSTRPRLKSLLWASLACLPLGFWMLMTAIQWDAQGEMHYLNVFGADSGGRIVLAKTILKLWEVAYQPLFAVPAALQDSLGRPLIVISQIAAGISFVFGAVHGLVKRQWSIIALLMFLILYVAIYAFYSFLYPKFFALPHWMVLLISLYGLKCLVRILSRFWCIPTIVVIVLQVALLVFAMVWIGALVPGLSKIAPYGRKAVSLPYVAVPVAILGTVLVALPGLLQRRKNKGAAAPGSSPGRNNKRAEKTVMPTGPSAGVPARVLTSVLTGAVLSLAIVSSHFTLVRVIGNGQRDMEFKLLADWYRQNAEQGEKLVTTMPGIVRIFAPEAKACFVHTKHISGDTIEQFLRTCYKKNIRYVAWDSRLGFYPRDHYYRHYGLKRIAVLGRDRSIGPFRFVGRVGRPQRFINIFRIEEN